ncbi:MAG: AAA family ATPase [Alphaproteobacteria bacterium]|nr:AAA family ATPase [Alphaproteobacteria bacterium]
MNTDGKQPFELEMTPQFEEAISLMETTDKNIFITGKAGTGKSTLLEYFCNNTEKHLAVLAPTGVAALNVKGQTIHRFFGFYIDVTPQKIRNLEIKPRRKKIYKQLKTIIIDEVSMVRADLLDCVDEFLRLYGPNPDTPFGGVQMIFIGDLYQLPPVVTSKERQIFTDHYKTPYFFSAHALDGGNCELEMLELEKIFRQKEEGFIKLLNAVRNNSIEYQDIESLNARFNPDFNPETEDDFYICLTSTNAKADEINAQHISKLTGRTFNSDGEIEGNFGKEYLPTAMDLKFKVGAQVMMVNNDPNKHWVNGSIGLITAISKDTEGKEFMKIRIQGSHRVEKVYPFTWEVYRFALEGNTIVSESIGSFTQYPIRLAWAVTIHKSQGKTFDNVIIDVGSRGTFVAGQMYVALSRCTSFGGIVLRTPLKKSHIRTDYRIFKFLNEYQCKKPIKNGSMQDNVSIIKKAIADKKALKITYLKKNDTASERTIEPISVVEKNHQDDKILSVQAYCLTRKDFRTFRVDRILEIAAT